MKEDVDMELIMQSPIIISFVLPPEYEDQVILAAKRLQTNESEKCLEIVVNALKAAREDKGEFQNPFGGFRYDRLRWGQRESERNISFKVEVFP